MVFNSKRYHSQVLIIGAGPSGLYAAFVLGLLGIDSRLIDVLPQAGGQCWQLYQDKPIYDLPAIAQCSARDLIVRLLEQLKPFDIPQHFNQLAQTLTIRSCEESKALLPFEVLTDKGNFFEAKTLLIASGAGAFLPRKPRLEGMDALNPQQLFYVLLPEQENSRFAGCHVVISGDLEETLLCANRLASQNADPPASVTLIHRRDKFRASDATLAKTHMLRHQGRLQFLAGSIVALKKTDHGCLQTLSVKMSADNQVKELPADTLFILHGASPILGPLENWPLELSNKHFPVDTGTCQTHLPGIFAIGDAVTYPGKRKLLVSSFHEATVAAYAIAGYLNGGASIPVQYTSSNTALQTRLKKL